MNLSEKSDDPRGSQRLAASIDPAELEKFAAMADEWWDPNGKSRPLHQLAPVRLAFIRREFGRQFGVDEKQPEPLRGRRVLDIGCGGGLISEPMARLGGTVTGVDAVEKNIAIARAHAAGMGLDIDYRTGTAEQMEAAGDGGFDLILNLEVVEHVADLDAFLEACTGLLAPGGVMIVSTINRTAKAFALAIVGAEYVLRWLPRGTHDWRKFLKPSELTRALRGHGLELAALDGMTYSPVTGNWGLDRGDVSVNYLAAFAHS